MSKSISYDGYFKELLDGFPDDDVVALINGLFGTTYPYDSKILRLATESHFDGEEKRSDTMLRIGKDDYLVEVQSENDESMPLRIFVYQYRAALQHRTTLRADYLRLDFPKTVVFYLRSNKNTPHELTIELKLPDSNIVSYKVPTKRLSEYKPEDLISKSMLIFAPFYSMLFENKIAKNPADVEKLRDIAVFLSDGIKERLHKEEISKNTADFATEALRCILKNVLDKAKVNHKEVDEVMEAVEKRYYLETTRQRAEGKAEGKAEGILEIALRMLGRGKSVEEIVEDTGLTHREIQRLQLH